MTSLNHKTLGVVVAVVFLLVVGVLGIVGMSYWLISEQQEGALYVGDISESVDYALVSSPQADPPKHCSYTNTFLDTCITKDYKIFWHIWKLSFVSTSTPLIFKDSWEESSESKLCSPYYNSKVSDLPVLCLEYFGLKK